MTVTRDRYVLLIVVGLLLLATALAGWLALTPSIAAAGSQDESSEVGRVEVVLAPDGYVVLPDGTRLNFTRVVSDSRCPIDVVCIWAGEVGVAFQLQTVDGEPHEFELSFDGHPATEVIEGYIVTVNDVQPRPRDGLDIDHGDYRVTVTIGGASQVGLAAFIDLGALGTVS